MIKELGTGLAKSINLGSKHLYPELFPLPDKNSFYLSFSFSDCQKKLENHQAKPPKHHAENNGQDCIYFSHTLRKSSSAPLFLAMLNQFRLGFFRIIP